jgi:hypothetical protein
MTDYRVKSLHLCWCSEPETQHQHAARFQAVGIVREHEAAYHPIAPREFGLPKDSSS